MNLKSRALRLVAVVSFISSIFVSPASANEITIDTSGVKVPAGITFAVGGVKGSEDGYSELLVTIESTLAPTSKVLTFKDFKISGIYDDPNARPQRIQYFYGDSFNQQLNLYLADLDITGMKRNIVISGTGTLEDRSDIAYPKSYAPVIAALDAMGLEVTEGSNTWSSNDTYGYYVLAKLKSGVSPFQIKVKSTTLSANGVAVEALNINSRPELMGVEPVEIDLGSGLVDPSIKLTGVTLSSVFSKYIPSTITSSITLPAGITSEGIQNDKIYYYSEDKKSYISLLLKNTTNKTISVDLATLKVVDKATGTAKTVATVDKTYSLVSIQPSTGPEDFTYVNFVGAGDLTENLTLDVQGTLGSATPSKFNLSNVKVPKGYKLLPLNFNNMSYDAKKKTTSVYLFVTKSGTSEDSPALSFKNIKLASGKSSTTYLYAGPYTDNDKDIQIYSHDIGSFTGDVRTGRTLTLSGTIEAIARTKYTNTATFSENDKGKIPYSNASSAEYWKYSAKTKTTSISHYFYPEEGSNVLTVYSCNLKILLNGKAIKAPVVGTKIDMAAQNREVVIATLPGDLRVKGGTVEVSGNYSLEPCK